MSLKTAREPWSLAARLTVWYGATALAVAGSVVAAVYLTVSVAVEVETTQGLAEMARQVHAGRDDLTRGKPDAEGLPMRAIGPDGRTVHESPLVAEHFPKEAFPAEGRSAAATADGRRFDLLTCRIDGWTYQLAYDRSAEVDFFAQVRRNILLAALPTLAAGLGVGYLLARLGLAPIRQLAAEMRAVTADRLDARVAVASMPAEPRQAAEAFNAVLDRLQAAFARLDEFSADVAHELRTPVHNFRQHVEVSLMGERSADDHRRAAERVLDEADRLARLIDRLLTFARVADPRRELDARPVAVTAEAEAVVEFFAPAAAEAGVSLTAVGPHGARFPLDAALFQRALSNLVGNALAATPAGGAVRIDVALAGSGLTVTVGDTGRGITPEALPHLFDRFYRSPEAKASGRGVGLGLAIVRRVAELHGGTVGVESALGLGTRVTLSLPVREDDTDVIAVPRA